MPPTLLSGKSGEACGWHALVPSRNARRSPPSPGHIREMDRRGHSCYGVGPFLTPGFFTLPLETQRRNCVQGGHRETGGREGRHIAATSWDEHAGSEGRRQGERAPPPPPGPASLPPPPPPTLSAQGRGTVPSRDRTHWNRIFSVALFVEHVLLETQSQVPELSELVTKYVDLLDKVSAQAPREAERQKPSRQFPAGRRLPVDAGSLT